METLSFSNNSTRAKILGTTVYVIGAFLVTLYKGPKIIWILSPFRSSSVSLGSSQDNWALGTLCLRVHLARILVHRAGRIVLRLIFGLIGL